MLFKLIWGNHWNFGLTILDTCILLKKAIELLGHRVDVERNVCPGEVNIIIENFNKEQTQTIVEAQKVAGTRFILIATEAIYNGQFNGFDSKMDNSYYSDNNYWFERFNNFVKVEKISSVIWHLGASCLNGYKNFFGHDRILYFPHFYMDDMNVVNHLSDEEKDIDILFTGCLTDYRKKTLEQLQSEGLNVFYEHALLAPFFRENLVARTKLSVNIRQHEHWPFPSTSRFFYHLINDSLLISEKYKESADTQKYIICSENKNFVKACKEQLEIGDFNRRAIKARKQFAIEKPMKPAINKLLNSTMQFMHCNGNYEH